MNPEVTQPQPLTIMLDLTAYKGVEVRFGEQFVRVESSRLLECLSWLLCDVDTDVIITKDGIEVDA